MPDLDPVAGEPGHHSRAEPRPEHRSDQHRDQRDRIHRDDRDEDEGLDDDGRGVADHHRAGYLFVRHYLPELEERRGGGERPDPQRVEEVGDEPDRVLVEVGRSAPAVSGATRASRGGRGPKPGEEEVGGQERQGGEEKCAGVQGVRHVRLGFLGALRTWDLLRELGAERYVGSFGCASRPAGRWPPETSSPGAQVMKRRGLPRRLCRSRRHKPARLRRLAALGRRHGLVRTLPPGRQRAPRHRPRQRVGPPWRHPPRPTTTPRSPAPRS